MRAIRLRTSYLNQPIGMDDTHPHFSWNCEEGLKQSAYRIVVKKINGGSTEQEQVMWDTGKVESSSMTHILYGGETLESRAQLSWAVCIWDENGAEGEWSEAASFEMGLLSSKDWIGKWISGDYKPKKNVRYPVDYFQKKVSVKKEIRYARLYASARGVYDVFVNGKRIEDFILAPGITDYNKRIQYQTYDVTQFITKNITKECTLGLRLADGWFRGSVAAYGVVNVFGMQTSMIAQLEIVYMDGTSDIIGTDSSFSWCNDGPVRFADLKDGEIYDASMKPSYSGKAKEVTAPKNSEILVASNNVPVREKEHFSPIVQTAADGTLILDFGQNIAGYLEFFIQGKKGQNVKFICGEVLDKEGKVDLSGIQESRPYKGWRQTSLIRKLLTNQVKGEVAMTPQQEIIYVCSGEAEYYKTSFAIFGFRYVQVEYVEDTESVAVRNSREKEAGDSEELLAENTGKVHVVNRKELEKEKNSSGNEVYLSDIHSIAVYSDMEQTGSFTCSNPLVNQLVQNTTWSMKGNFLDIPTDCPTRERLGWTGDAQIFFETGAYLMDTAAFFRKWLLDMEDSQYENGLIPAVIPLEGVEMMYKSTGSSVGWADAIYLIPYRFYKYYGDKELLRRYWPMMKKYADYLMGNLGLRSEKEGRENPYNAYTYEKGIHLGEWLEPEEFRDPVYGTQAKHPEECTAYLYLAMNTLAEIADLFDENGCQDKYREIAEGAKQAYQYIVVEKGGLDTNRQAKLVRPIKLGILSPEEQKKAEEKLVKAVEEYRYRVGTGFLSTPFLLPVLTEGGRADIAYKMLENTEKPGWLAEVQDGATTIWENWEGDLSQNHYSPGAVCQWLFDTAAGIRVAGENRFVVAPVPGGTLDYAEASYQSIYGNIKSGWKRLGDGWEFIITIPANTTAEVILPDGTKEERGAGTYCYQIV